MEHDAPCHSIMVALMIVIKAEHLWIEKEQGPRLLSINRRTINLSVEESSFREAFHAVPS